MTLTPYAVKFPEESGRMNNDFKQAGEEFTIYLNNQHRDFIKNYDIR